MCAIDKGWRYAQPPASCNGERGKTRIPLPGRTTSQHEILKTHTHFRYRLSKREGQACRVVGRWRKRLAPVHGNLQPLAEKRDRERRRRREKKRPVPRGKQEWRLRKRTRPCCTGTRMSPRRRRRGKARCSGSMLFVVRAVIAAPALEAKASRGE